MGSEVYWSHTGPPLPPAPSFTLINETAVNVTWQKPFTWEQFDILNYIVRITNATSGEGIKNVTIHPTVNQAVMSYVMDNLEECHEIQFNVTAVNAVGKSRDGYVLIQFPKGTHACMS